MKTAPTAIRLACEQTRLVAKIEGVKFQIFIQLNSILANQSSLHAGYYQIYSKQTCMRTCNFESQPLFSNNWSLKTFDNVQIIVGDRNRLSCEPRGIPQKGLQIACVVANYVNDNDVICK